MQKTCAQAVIGAMGEKGSLNRANIKIGWCILRESANNAILRSTTNEKKGLLRVKQSKNIDLFF
jgi:hypothetical protein